MANGKRFAEKKKQPARLPSTGEYVCPHALLVGMQTGAATVGTV